MLLRNGETVCLGDFGEARALGERDGVRLSKAHGTECVQAPEVLSGVQQGFDASAKVTTKADCWALGCLWYELLTGSKLFEEMACNDWPRFFVLLTGGGELPPADLVGVFSGLAQREAILGVFRHAFMRDASKTCARELAGLGRCRRLLSGAAHARRRSARRAGGTGECYVRFDPGPALRPALLQRSRSEVGRSHRGVVVMGVPLDDRWQRRNPTSHCEERSIAH